MPNYNKHWSDKDVAYLKENFKTMSYDQIGAHLGKKGNAVKRYYEGQMGSPYGRKPMILNKPHWRSNPAEPKIKEPEPEKKPITRPPATYSNKSGYLGTLEKYA